MLYIWYMMNDIYFVYDEDIYIFGIWWMIYMHVMLTMKVIRECDRHDLPRAVERGTGSVCDKLYNFCSTIIFSAIKLLVVNTRHFLSFHSTCEPGGKWPQGWKQEAN